MLEWVDWFNTRRLLGPIGDIPPAEFEAQYCRGRSGLIQTIGLRHSRYASLAIQRFCEVQHEIVLSMRKTRRSRFRWWAEWQPPVAATVPERLKLRT
jgi:hypothetical protein